MKTRNTFKRLLNYFFQGLLFLGPLAVTIYAVRITFLWIDGLLYKHIEEFLGLEIPGLGLVTLLLFITLIGFLGSLFFFKPFITYFDKMISRAPLIKIIYTSVKDLLSAFVGNKRRFNKPVLVRVSGSSSLEKIGFITNEDLSELGITDGRIAVYLPHSYAWSGNLFIVPAENVTPINASATNVMKYIISAGVTKL
ncbi:MAG: DUF502 domain-containing protein [Bacteroidales bacterium]|jgi:uncharacterized membrane protein|nr:DUF502 domain-containing protein [Bacteroidales bacterium]MDD3131160.1 DUF502 domain-containing protein [Bacteroidales bacterium]MDD3526951.1 DUF502 domain-containing protein [Bacteroidales bacterium]MDY0336045.1 DUF502 domain-containing protein [Bacteroidales bacterium]NLO51071.1 DUF502 domain-containing protein [Bacteroidales bacterium]